MSNRVANIYRDVIRKKGDNWPPAYAVIKDDDGATVDLTDATVKLCTRPFGGGAWVETAGTVEDPANGVVSVVPPTTTAGRYLAYFEVTQTSKTYTMPESGYLLLEILDSSA